MDNADLVDQKSELLIFQTQLDTGQVGGRREQWGLASDTAFFFNMTATAYRYCLLLLPTATAYCYCLPLAAYGLTLTTRYLPAYYVLLTTVYLPLAIHWIRTRHHVLVTTHSFYILFTTYLSLDHQRSTWR